MFEVYRFRMGCAKIEQSSRFILYLSDLSQRGLPAWVFFWELLKALYGMCAARDIVCRSIESYPDMSFMLKNTSRNLMHCSMKSV